MILIILILAILFLVWYRSRVWSMSVLKRNGISGPKPNPIWGNILQFRNVPTIQIYDILIKKYGKIVGIYFGKRPMVLVADKELAKLIQIKDFQYFADRPPSFFKNGNHVIPAFSKSIVRAVGKRWKEMRSVMTPTFSASKLKTMSPIIDDAINNLIEIIEKHSKSETEFNIYNMFQNLTTDVIGRTAFGMQCNFQNEFYNKFLNSAKAIFNHKLNAFSLFVVMCFPMMNHILYPFRLLIETIKDKLGLSSTGILIQMVKDIIRVRQNSNIRRQDILQLMLDTKISAKEVSDMTDEYLTIGGELKIKTNSKGVIKPKESVEENKERFNKKDVNLTDEEITSNCVLFYEAAFESTSTVLGFVAHILVNYPEIQERIRNEVKELYESEGKLDFNTVYKLQYMECVLNETMRVYPPAINFISRHCLQDYKYKDITIPKGATVLFANYNMHHDPDNFPEPEKFDPERFSPERKHEIHPSSWQPFGSGPRNCIGMRLALFEIKLTLAKILHNYKLVASPKTEMGELTVEDKIISLTPKYGVFIKIIKL